MATFQQTERPDEMLEVEEAQARTLSVVNVLGTEQAALSDALGRILREDVYATNDVPQSDNTAMDGYAVREADIAAATSERPRQLTVVEDLPAGKVPEKSVEPGTAIRIMTGAPIPIGADTVVPVELTDAGSSTVSIRASLSRGANIRRRGEDMHSGDRVLPSGVRLGSAELGVLATVQKAEVTVARRPTVAILSTGDEIIDLHQTMIPGKVVNSNSWSLAALTREAGAVPRLLGIVGDTREATMRAIQSASDCDFIISSGGVSVGAYDFVKDALDALGAETMFWQVAMKPGKPVVLARLGECIYFGLPGNPVSCMVSFILFIAPSLRKAMGSANLFSPVIQIRLGEDVRSRGDRRAYQRVRVYAREGALEALPMRSQGSGVSTSMVGANGLAVMERGVRLVKSGQTVPVVLFGAVEAV